MMRLRITKDKDGQWYLERGEFGSSRVYRQSEFPEGLDDASIEGMGYLAIEKLYPDQDIEGYNKNEETLYIAKSASYIR
jgi:hypothetical protein